MKSPNSARGVGYVAELGSRPNDSYYEKEGGQMPGNLDKLAGPNQNLQPLLMALGKVQAGDANGLKQFKDFISENADHILSARPLLESDGLLQLVRQFVPSVNEKDLKRAVGILLDLSEQTVKKRR